MKKQGFVIVRTNGADQYFTASSSYDRARWVRLSEATTYASAEEASSAARKLWTKGHFGAKAVIAETQGGIMSDIEAADTADAKGQMAGAVADMSTPVEDEEAMEIEFSTEPTCNCPGQPKAHDTGCTIVTTMPDLVRGLAPQQGDALSGADTEEEESCEDSEQSYSRIRFLKGTPVAYNGRKFIVVQDSGTGVVAIAPAGNPTATPVKVKVELLSRIEDNMGESATMPTRPGNDPATPDENDTTIPNLKEPKVTEIDFEDPVGVEHKPETDIDYATDRPHEEKVKVPADVMSALRAQKAEFKKCVDYNNGRDDNRASFCMTCHDCMAELEELLSIGTVEAIKQAQIKMTSWMNPITTNIPANVRDFILRGGRQPSLKDLFDMKRGEKLIAAARTGFGAVKN